MKADTLTPRELFEGKVQFEIPSFQRPYVWTEEDQWAPLWEDVKRVARDVIEADGDAEKLKAHGAHFLGAIVVKDLGHQAGDVARSAVIDGQQRMTTLQILLDAAHAAVDDLGYEDDAEFLEGLIVNPGRKFAGTKERFKLWPSRTDRAAFEAAMDGSVPPDLVDARVVEAHRFFEGEVRRWLTDGPEDEPPLADQDARAAALAYVLQSRISLVAIDLDGNDDDQVIFETLNDRGTPLLAADLIKNWVFQRGTDLKADTEHWAEGLWADLGEEWWREEISQGRHLRSRIDIFLQYWLTMRTQEEVLTDGVFRRFREYAIPHFADLAKAEGFLQELRRDADTFRSFAQLDSDTVPGRFYSRVIEALELAAVTPLLLWLLSENHDVPDDQVEVALASLESWVIRRTMLRMTMKDVNKLMVAMLKVLGAANTGAAGDSVRGFLQDQEADARLWPSDADMLAYLPDTRLYGNVRQARLRVVLQGIEKSMRTEMHENTSLPDHLEVEHVMPRGWRTHWNEDPPLDADAASARSKLVDTFGNLTLATQKLNGSLSHRPWSDVEAKEAAPTGKHAGMGKRSLLEEYSLLAMNKTLIGGHAAAWTEDDIRARGADLTTRLCSVWPR